MKGKDKFNWRNHIKDLYLVGSISSAVVGGVVAFIGNSLGNPVLIVFGFCGLAGGFMLFRAGRHIGDVRLIKNGEGDKPLLPPNSLNVYEKKIEFAHIEKPKGQSVKCLNDSKFYHVHIDGDSKEGLKELQLPDDDEKERYYDPAEFANPVTMPSNKKYFTWSASTMQKISVGIMALVIAGEIIGLIAIP